MDDSRKPYALGMQLMKRNPKIIQQLRREWKLADEDDVKSVIYDAAKKCISEGPEIGFIFDEPWVLEWLAKHKGE